VRQAIESAGQLLADGKYDRAIRLLESAGSQNPRQFDLEVMLARALLAKSASGGSTSKDLAKRPYEIGRRLNRIDPYRPEPYFIVGRALLIYGRAGKAGKMAEKAIYYARGTHEDLAEYWMLLGDACMQRMYYSKARKAYETGSAEAAARNQHHLFEQFKWRLVTVDRVSGQH